MVAVADYMTVDEAARELGLTRRGVHKRIERGDMRAERFGDRVVLIPVDEVQRWREIGRLKPGPKKGSIAEYRQDEAEHTEAPEAGHRRIRGEPGPKGREE